MYLPVKHPVHAFKQNIQAAWKQLKALPYQSAVCVRVVAYFSRPKAITWKRRPNPRQWHAKKPDVDNVAKAVIDALNKLAWIDDAQVCELLVIKIVCDGTEQARVEIEVSERNEHD